MYDLIFKGLSAVPCSGLHMSLWYWWYYALIFHPKAWPFVWKGFHNDSEMSEIVKYWDSSLLKKHMVRLHCQLWSVLWDAERSQGERFGLDLNTSVLRLPPTFQETERTVCLAILLFSWLIDIIIIITLKTTTAHPESSICHIWHMEK